MGLEIPSWLQSVATVAVGSSWPQADETALRRMSDVWGRGAIEVGNLGQSGIRSAELALTTIEGDTHDALEQKWKTLAGDAGSDGPDFFSLTRDCDALAERCNDMANSVERAKMLIISSLAILVAQLAAMAAAAIPTAGASMAGAAAAEVATQITIRMILQQLLIDIGKELGEGFVMEVLPDVLVQSEQIFAGNRDGFDWDLLEESTKTAAAHVMAGHVADYVPEGLLESAAGQIATNAVVGAVQGAAGVLVNGEEVKITDLTSGAIGNVIGSGAPGQMVPHVQHADPADPSNPADSADSADPANPADPAVDAAPDSAPAPVRVSSLNLDPGPGN